jgi:amino acid transporter
MAISRDGLLPKAFSKIHPVYKTPSFATIVTGFVVAIPALFMNLTMVTDLCSIGTLFAFVLVCGGVLMLQNKKDIPRGKFKTPYLNAKYIMPILFVGTIFLLNHYAKDSLNAFVFNEPVQIVQKDFVENLSSTEIDAVKGLVMTKDSIAFAKESNDLETYISKMDKTRFKDFMLAESKIPNEKKMTSGWALFKHKIPVWIFILTCFILSILAFLRNLSLIPILGVISCLYLMSQIELKNWIGFTIWLVIGLVIYLFYGMKHSKLNTQNLYQK